MKYQILEILNRLKVILARTKDVSNFSRDLGEDCKEIEMILDSLQATVARQIDHRMGVKLNKPKVKK